MTSLIKLAAAAALTLAMGVSAAFAQDTIKFGVAAEPYKPFTVKGADGNWTGWEVDLRDAVCREIKVKCEWVETAWDGIIPALLAKKFDVIWSSMTITEERAKTISFTDKYYKTGTAILAAKDAKLTADEAGLTGKVLGAQVSTTQLDYANKYFKGVVKELKTYQTQDEVNQDLAAGRIDAQIVDSIPGQDFVNSDAGKACCIYVGDVKDDLELLGPGQGAGLRKEDNELREKINAAIKKIRASGEYFTMDIYGG
jgi:polar amino acid transport system substrate-binding protein